MHNPASQAGRTPKIITRKERKKSKKFGACYIRAMEQVIPIFGVIEITAKTRANTQKLDMAERRTPSST